MRKEAKNKAEKLIYEEKDIESAMNQWEGIDYHKEFSIEEFKDVNFLIIETLYGDREHEEKNERNDLARCLYGPF